MHPLSEDGRRILTELAARHGISLDAATHMLMAVAAGGDGHQHVGGGVEADAMPCGKLRQDATAVFAKGMHGLSDRGRRRGPLACRPVQLRRA